MLRSEPVLYVEKDTLVLCRYTGTGSVHYKTIHIFFFVSVEVTCQILFALLPHFTGKDSFTLSVCLKPRAGAG